ncbi:MAG: uracil phosphoribosyltransferase, partial [Bacteroidetes bacterium]|nr:uracil phosphoribosyltransferase [Bacteroidota bacterium]
FFEGIASLFQDVLFIPFDLLRVDIQPDSWWAANGVNLIFLFIGLVFFAYWMKQLKIFSKTENTQEDEETYLI